MEPRFALVVVDVEAADAEEAGAQLFELGAQGVEERDATTLAKGAPGKVTLVASFPDAASAERARGELPGAWAPRTDEIVGDAWRDDWKKYFHPFEVCPGIVVRPPWEAYEGAAATKVLVLEPGRAFGTGLHESTALVARVLSDFADEVAGAEVLDVGCGSGILALVALTLGARSARCVDVDPEALAVAKENAARNGLSDRVRADETSLDGVEGGFAVVVANIEAGTLARMADALAQRVRPGGLLILSGILAPSVAPGQVAEVERAYQAGTRRGAPRVGFERLEVRTQGEWAAVVMRGRGAAS